MEDTFEHLPRRSVLWSLQRLDRHQIPTRRIEDRQTVAETSIAEIHLTFEVCRHRVPRPWDLHRLFASSGHEPTTTALRSNESVAFEDLARRTCRHRPHTGPVDHHVAERHRSKRRVLALQP